MVRKAFFGILLSVLASAAFGEAARHYSLFVDAGSSGSRVHIIERQDSSPMPLLSDIFSASIKPGLSSYADHPEKAGASLKPILDAATDYLNNQHVAIADASISVLATAGMRLLSEEQQKLIFTDVRDYIKQHYAYRIDEIGTIDGKMEGLYSWLDVNYLLGNFQNNKPTLGSIDMGGASVELTFATTDQTKTNDELEIDINHQHYTIFSKSILGLGQDQARYTMMALPDASTCFPKGYQFEKNKLGKYAYDICQSMYENVIEKYRERLSLPDFGGQTFVAYSGIYYAYHFFKADQVLPLSKQVKVICSTPWTDLKKQYPSIEDKYLSSYCANGAYIDELLFRAFDLKPKQLIVADTLNGQTIDWTLGAALYQIIKA